MAATPKVRLRFAKNGDLRLVSHHDLVRCVERMVRRAGLPVAVSQGFNPRPKITFTLSLALGIEGRREPVEFEFTEPLEPADVLDRLARQSPSGLVWLSAEPVEGRKSAQASSVTYAFPIPADRVEATSVALEALPASTSRPFTRRRPDRSIDFDVRPFLLDAALDPEGCLRFRLGVTNSGTAARPEDIIEILGLDDLLRDGSVLVRTDVELSR